MHFNIVFLFTEILQYFHIQYCKMVDLEQTLQVIFVGLHFLEVRNPFLSWLAWSQLAGLGGSHLGRCTLWLHECHHATK